MLLVSAIAAGALHLAWPHLSSPHLSSPLPHTIPTQGMRRRASYKIRTKSYRLDGWEMRITRDGFTGHTQCRLFAPKGLRQGEISYANGVMGFHFGPSHDVAQAWYSVDDKPPRPWRDDYPALIARRVPLESGSLANPTGGMVMIPTEALTGAQTVTIRAEREASPRRFRLKGFEQALAAASANGCAGSTGFVRDPW